MSATLLRSATIAAAPSTTPARVSTGRPSRRAIIAGRVLSGIASVLLALDSGFKLAMSKSVVEASAQLGFSPQQVFIIGVIAAVCLVLYLIPRTAPLGAVLWTGYFGGAILLHFRLGNPLLTHVLSPIYISTLIWGGLYLRDPRIRAVLGTR